jgi:hypothetical protein
MGLPGLVYQGSYDSTHNYALGDVVQFGGSSYASLIAGNAGLSPGACSLLRAASAQREQSDLWVRSAQRASPARRGQRV